MIEIKHLRKEYGTLTPLEDVNVTINDGDVISVIGPSGTGKSTFIRCINLLEKPSSGQIIFNGVDITSKGYDIRKARRRIGMVFQSFNLFGHMTVIENIMAAPVDLLGSGKKDAYNKGMELLSRVGLSDKALSYPDELSGGQKQRVAIARTLCMDPEVILMDEPTSALDPTMVSEVQNVIRELSKSGRTMLIVTHEMNFARSISNRVFYMDKGGIYEEGTPDEIFLYPSKELTRRFIHRLKVFETEITSESTSHSAFEEGLNHYLLINDILPSMQYRIQLALEELVWGILLPRYRDPDINISVEYSVDDALCRIAVIYKGEAFDFRESDNRLSLSLLSSIANNIEYSCNKEIEENRVVFTVS